MFYVCLVPNNNSTIFLVPTSKRCLYLAPLSNLLKTKLCQILHEHTSTDSGEKSQLQIQFYFHAFQHYVDWKEQGELLHYIRLHLDKVDRLGYRAYAINKRLGLEMRQF